MIAAALGALIHFDRSGYSTLGFRYDSIIRVTSFYNGDKIHDGYAKRGRGIGGTAGQRQGWPISRIRQDAYSVSLCGRIFHNVLERSYTPYFRGANPWQASI